MATIYQQNNATNPTSQGWSLKSGTAPTSDGSKWNSSASGTISLDNVVTFSGKELYFECKASIPSTSLSYVTPMRVISGSKNACFSSRWEDNNIIYTMSSAGHDDLGRTYTCGSERTYGIKVLSDGSVKMYIGGVLVKTYSSAIFSNGDVLSIDSYRYFESANMTIRDMILTEASNTTNFFQLF